MNEIIAIEQLIVQVSALDRVEQILREMRHDMQIQPASGLVHGIISSIIQIAINKAINKRIELLEDYWRDR